MKLFFMTGSFSMSVVNAVEELEIPCELVEVSIKRNVNVEELKRHNPAGLVSTLVSDAGAVITQNAAVLEYLADQKPSVGLLAPAGSVERGQTMAWISMCAAELHQTFRQGFRAREVTENEEEQAKIRAYAKARIEKFFGYATAALTGKRYLMGEQFTIADCHLVVDLGFAKGLQINLAGQFPELDAYRLRVQGRPGIKRALEREAGGYPRS